MSDFQDNDSEKVVSGTLDRRQLFDLHDPNEGGQRVISARGTEEGLVLRIDGRSEWREITRELRLFLGQRRRFLEGGEVAIEWLDRLPTKEQSQELEILLREDFAIEIIGRRAKNPKQRFGRAKSEKLVAVNKESKMDAAKRAVSTIPLFEDLEEEGPADSSLTSRVVSRANKPAGSAERPRSGLSSDIEVAMMDNDLPINDLPIKESDRQQLRRVGELLGEEVFGEDEANARVFYGTLRSGQRVETPFSLVVVGDVNPGADLVAGGDILVFGSLRGTAHASAYDDECQERVIVALQMQPMQLRIGSVISRGNGESVRGAEIARIEDRRIIVESFNPRSMGTKRVRS